MLIPCTNPENTLYLSIKQSKTNPSAMPVSQTPLFYQPRAERAQTIIRCATESNAKVIVAALFATDSINSSLWSFDACVQSFKDAALSANGQFFMFGGLWFAEQTNHEGILAGQFLCHVDLSNA